jgi:hypothetical protein
MVFCSDLMGLQRCDHLEVKRSNACSLRLNQTQWARNRSARSFCKARAIKSDHFRLEVTESPVAKCSSLDPMPKLEVLGLMVSSKDFCEASIQRRSNGVKKTVEDAFNLIVENAAVVQSAMYDPQLSAISQMGVGKLVSEIEELTLRIRATLEEKVLLLELHDPLT